MTLNLPEDSFLALPPIVALGGHLSAAVLPVLERAVEETALREAVPFDSFVGVMGTDAGPVLVYLDKRETACIRPLVELFRSKRPGVEVDAEGPRY